MVSLRFGSLTPMLLLLPAVGCFNPPDVVDTPETTLVSTSTSAGVDTTADTVDGTVDGTDAPPECGNGLVESGEECDDGGESATCDADCTMARCGDGVVNQAAGEICDDGNDDPDDDCNTMCMPLGCGDGVVTPPEQCDDGNRDQTDDCVACQVASCGDGYVQAGVETCDDGNDDDTDPCPSTCQTATCGDGFVQAGVETCDDGNDDDTDPCPSTCQTATCGDGFVQAGVETCDDANDVPDDGCDACSLTCGNDCWSDAGCMTAAGRCIRFTCTTGAGSTTACSNCFGWQPITYDQWLMGGYCSDVIARYRDDHGFTTMCGEAPLCCGDPVACSGGDNAWHFSNGVDNYFVGPCLGCMGDANCTFWNGIDNSNYTRITACERISQ
jgi:cysteine-rich repeat protein